MDVDDALKALECCQFNECEACTLRGYGVYCKKKLIKSTEAIIESLKAENENLRHCVHAMMAEMI